MSFFEQPPAPLDDPERRRQPPWIGPPENALGAAVPLRLLLARTERAAVAITGCNAYADGAVLDLALRLRPGSLSVAERRALQHGGPFHARGPFEGGELPPELLRFGVQFADGRKATSLSGPSAFDGASGPGGPVLMPRGGGGSEHAWNMEFWLWPLPPAGPLAFVVEWPALGIPETRVESDASGIVAAAASAELLWPEDDGSSPGGGGYGFHQRVSTMHATGQTDDG